MMFQTLRDVQGLHAPLILQMERKITSRVSIYSKKEMELEE